MLSQLFIKSYQSIHEKIYAYRTVKMEPSDWAEENLYMTSTLTNYPGFLKYNRSPWSREMIDSLSPNSGIEMVAAMKNNQSGFTATVLMPFICYLISENPSSIMFLSGTDVMATGTIRDKLDPLIQSSGLEHLIKSQDTRKRNSRTGNTDNKKEFAGGNLIIGSYKPSNLRMHSVKNILADEFDDAPFSDKKEGSTRKLLENRTTAFPGKKKIAYLSTPTIAGRSNIEKVFKEGDQRHWHWNCPHCKNWIDVLWSVEREDGSTSGMKYELNENNELIDKSIYFECKECRGKIFESDKRKLNEGGMWIPTATPKRPEFRSYQCNAIFTFDTWRDLCFDWVSANPFGKTADLDALKTFINTKLGQTWVERGTSLKVSDMMRDNQRTYKMGVVPDVTCEADGNGKIVLITMACDLGGVMETNNEDVRLDWEIIAHSANGATYSIKHGSIGTFKRTRTKKRAERENESERTKWTYSHGQNHSVWPKLKEIIYEDLVCESGEVVDIDMTLIDSGHFTKLTYDFVRDCDDPFIVSVKGYGEEEYRKLSKDTPVVKRSLEQAGKLYILQVNQLKDILASNMKLKFGMDGYQPSGFMNYPQPDKGFYSMNNYFSHFEAEHRVEQKSGDVVVAFSWKKKNSSLENHYFDIYNYNIAAKYVYIDIIRRTHTKNSKLTWDDYVSMINEN